MTWGSVSAQWSRRYPLHSAHCTSRNPMSKWCKDAQSAVLAATMISTSEVWLPGHQLFDASAVAVLSLLSRTDLWEIILPVQPTLQLGYNSDVYLL